MIAHVQNRTSTTFSIHQNFPPRRISCFTLLWLCCHFAEFWTTGVSTSPSHSMPQLSYKHWDDHRILCCECETLSCRVRINRYRIAICNSIKFNSDASPNTRRKVATQNFENNKHVFSISLTLIFMASLTANILHMILHWMRDQL